MKEVSTNFDYSIVDDTTAQFLKLKEQELQSIVLNSSIQLGEKLIEAQEKLASFKTGTFEKWFTSIGLKKRTVYNYINQAKFVHQMHEYEQIEMFQELPTTLKTEISKPSAKPEAVEMVLSGDIKTTKEYRELEKQLKAKDEQIKLQAQMIDDLNEQETEVVEKEVIVEKVPDDYQQLKQSTKIVDEITRENQALKAEQEALKQRIADSEKALQEKAKVENDELEQAQLKRLKRDADISVHKLIINMNQFVKEQAVTVYDSQAIAGANDETKQKLTDSISRVEKLLKQIKQEIGGEVAWVIN
ncbi:Atg14 domain-containing protein [Enterococcus gallinarum]|uniref:Atg14 domain-containing protein n=1 Tax=Enterococcus gallinarum TaxID=1353 RepID=UPI001D088591|nr:Atg14 domain-containing protein [Enterococcus gallinarum]MCB7449062.1 Atg14 domain-containing protein [Enterococcus gallinarum]